MSPEREAPATSNIRRTKKPKDPILFASLVSAYKAKAIVVLVHGDRLNRPGSPVWNAGENVAPLLVVVLIPLIFTFIANLVVGIAMMLVGLLLYFLLIRPWMLLRLQRHALTHAMETLRNWEVLWQQGGLTIALNRPHTKKGRCVSPKGDWRAFVVDYFPPQKVDGSELHEMFFRRTGKDETDRETLSESNIDM